jgi:hypothetical protein
MDNTIYGSRFIPKRVEKALRSTETLTSYQYDIAIGNAADVIGKLIANTVKKLKKANCCKKSKPIFLIYNLIQIHPNPP